MITYKHNIVFAIFVIIIASAMYAYYNHAKTAENPVNTKTQNIDTGNLEANMLLEPSTPEETYPETNADIFTWIVRPNINQYYDIFLRTESGEHEIVKDAHDCVAVNMFDAPEKNTKDLLYPTLKCAMDTTVEFYGVYINDKKLTVKRVSANSCNEYGSCDLTKESKGKSIE